MNLMERYRELLPITADTPSLTLGEGATPLLAAPRLARGIGVEELWLKLVSHECANLVGELDHDDLWGATARLTRIIRTQRALVDEMRILHTLTPAAYQVIRASIRSATNVSGNSTAKYTSAIVV